MGKEARSSKEQKPEDSLGAKSPGSVRRALAGSLCEFPYKLPKFWVLQFQFQDLGYCAALLIKLQDR